MTRAFITIAALSALASNTAAADDHAQYGANISLSPFGGAINLSYNTSVKTSITAAIGGAPEGKAPFKPKVDGTEYEVTAGSSWTGLFLNHRPFENANWFRVNTGIGFGSIQQTLEDKAGNTYSANYTENPVGYFGLGAGLRPVEGFVFGFDLGFLHTGGPDIVKTGGEGDDASADIADHPLLGASTLPNLQLSFGWGF